MRMIFFAPSHRPPNKGAQRRLCASTSSPSSSQPGTLEQTVTNVDCSLGIEKKGSLEYPLVKEQAAANWANLKVKVLDKKSSYKLQNCLALATLFSEANE